MSDEETLLVSSDGSASDDDNDETTPKTNLNAVRETRPKHVAPVIDHRSLVRHLRTKETHARAHRMTPRRTTCAAFSDANLSRAKCRCSCAGGYQTATPNTCACESSANGTAPRTIDVPKPPPVLMLA